MIWTVFLVIAAVVFAVFVLLAITREKSKRKKVGIFQPSNILCFGVVLSAILLFIPIYNEVFKSSGGGLFETVMISIHNMIRLFIVDGEFEFVINGLATAPAIVSKCYMFLFSILFVLAPILTFGFVLSFFKNLTAFKRYFTHYNSDVYIFSELNERSVTLAQSLLDNAPKTRLIIFTDIYEKNEESNELADEAKALGAICFKKDIAAIDFSFHSKKRELNFFTIGNDQSENISHSLKLIEKFKYRDKTNLYVFSTQVEAGILIANAFDRIESRDNRQVLLKSRRINEVQSLINRTLYEIGFEKIFSSAYCDKDDVKRINAVIIGMGTHGTEMTKALSWFCQMDGYEIEINSFDGDKYALEKFTSQCPELMKLSGKTDIRGESRYKITVHSGIDIDTVTFDNIISELPRTTYVFVALGDDEKNIAAAVKLRELFERGKCSPTIQAVVYNTEKKEALNQIKNFKGTPYNIDFIGDTKTSYSEEVILDSDVEREALERHKRWGNECDFWRYEYNYKSSVASAIHRKMKSLCGIPGIDKKPEERTEAELWSIRILEHRRWNAYMRSEGYIYGGTVEKCGRNDLAKMHNCLVPFDELPLEEQIKDDD